MIFGKDDFIFKPADFYPFKDLKEIERVRNITKEDIIALDGKHPTSPSMSVNVIKNEEFEMIMLTDMLRRIIDSDRYDKKCIEEKCPCHGVQSEPGMVKARRQTDKGNPL